MVEGLSPIHARSMDYLARSTRLSLGLRRRRHFARSTMEHVSSIEERIPRWILGAVLMLVCVQLAIAL